MAAAAVLLVVKNAFLVACCRCYRCGMSNAAGSLVVVIAVAAGNGWPVKLPPCVPACSKRNFCQGYVE